MPRLLGKGHDITVLVRDPSRIDGREWFDQVEVIEGDLLDADGTWISTIAQQQFDVAYYLVHSMTTSRDFVNKDRLAAHNFSKAATQIPHTIYLGGLLPKGDAVSPHLRSRADTGEVLRTNLPVTEFRAGPVIGSGSASFEMVRYLTERLPVMVAPKWVRNRVQPIAVRDILAYLMAAMKREPLGIVEVGMPGEMTFKDMMLGYANVRGLRRWIYPLPVLTPGLAARWVGLVTPIPNSLAVPLIQGVVHPVTGDTSKARQYFPQIEPIGYEEAVEYAMIKISHREVETRWSGALGLGPTYRLVDWEGTIREERTIHVKATPEATFQAFCSLGGDRGWLVMNWAWRLRGWLDKLTGGPGLRRGRRDPLKLLAGEPCDFWRVEEVREPKLLRLRAEMKVPGKAWLQWEAWPEAGGTRLVQCALFRPQGFPGVIYWYSLYVIHKYIFSAMVRGVAKLAETDKV